MNSFQGSELRAQVDFGTLDACVDLKHKETTETGQSAEKPAEVRDQLLVIVGYLLGTFKVGGQAP
jgi:hypothetical protein